MGAQQRVAAAANGQFARQYDHAYKESGYSPERAPKLRFRPGINASPRKRECQTFAQRIQRAHENFGERLELQ
jgi:hypothetical protein